MEAVAATGIWTVNKLLGEGLSFCQTSIIANLEGDILREAIFQQTLSWKMIDQGIKIIPVNAVGAVLDENHVSSGD